MSNRLSKKVKKIERKIFYVKPIKQKSQKN